MNFNNYETEENSEANNGDSGFGCYLKGPPFNPKDYMISPSSSDASIVKEKIVTPPSKKDLLSCDLKYGTDWAVNWNAALKKLHSLVNDKFAVKFISRQKDLLLVFVKGTPIGFMLEDISFVTDVMGHFYNNYHMVPDYLEFLKCMLKVACGAPKLAKSSDILYYQKNLSDYLTLYGQLLTAFEDYSIQLQILEILEKILIRKTPTDIDCVKLSHCHAAVEQSHLPSVIASLLETIPENLYLKYLNIALYMSSVSLISDQSLIQNNAIEHVLWRLNPSFKLREGNIQSIDPPTAEELINEDHAYYENLEVSTRLLWGLFSVISDFGVQAPSPTLKALLSLKYVFHIETKKKTRRAIDMRNNLAGLIVKLYNVFQKKIPVCQSGLATDIAMISVATEIVTRDTWAEDVQFSASNEDFLLKRLMLLGCYELIKDECTTKIMKTQKVIEGVLHLISPKSNDLTIPWSPDQYSELFDIALRVLSELAPALSDVFITNEGNTRLLMTLESLTEKHFEQNQLLDTLSALCGIVTCENNSDIIKDLKDQYAIKTILDVCSHILDKGNLSRSRYEELSRAFIILEVLLKNDRKNMYMFSDPCVVISIKLFHKILNNASGDSKCDSRFLISFGTFIWEVIVWCPYQRNSFIEQGGVFLILDLIQTSILPVQMLYLGILVDMSDEGDAVSHLLTWRGRNGFGILTLLIEIWKKEENKNKVERKDGCISNVGKPLMTEEQWLLTNNVKNANICSPSIAEMIASARPKIHALYQLLNERYEHTKKISEESYCLHLDAIPTSFQVYVPLIEHFLALKIGEVWYEVLQYLEHNGIFPTSFDGEMISTLIDEKNKWASRVKTLQEEILAFQKIKGLNEEKSFYEFLKNCRLTESLEALRELDYIARTTCKEFQKQKKQRQIHEIEKFISNLDRDITIHRTFIPTCNVTHLFCKDIKFQSEKRESVQTEEIRVVSEINM